MPYPRPQWWQLPKNIRAVLDGTRPPDDHKHSMTLICAGRTSFPFQGRYRLQVLLSICYLVFPQIK